MTVEQSLRAQLRHSQAREMELRKEKDAAYRERDRLVALIAFLVLNYGEGDAALTRHEGTDWEDDWRNIVCVYLPNGAQLTWHIHDSELPLFRFLRSLPHDKEFRWDGHSTKEKYSRIAAYTGSIDAEQSVAP